MVLWAKHHAINNQGNVQRLDFLSSLERFP